MRLACVRRRCAYLTAARNAGRRRRCGVATHPSEFAASVAAGRACARPPPTAARVCGRAAARSVLAGRRDNRKTAVGRRVARPFLAAAAKSPTEVARRLARCYRPLARLAQASRARQPKLDKTARKAEQRRPRPAPARRYPRAKPPRNRHPVRFATRPPFGLYGRQIGGRAAPQTARRYATAVFVRV